MSPLIHHFSSSLVWVCLGALVWNTRETCHWENIIQDACRRHLAGKFPWSMCLRRPWIQKYIEIPFGAEFMAFLLFKLSLLIKTMFVATFLFEALNFNYGLFGDNRFIFRFGVQVSVLAVKVLLSLMYTGAVVRAVTSLFQKPMIHVLLFLLTFHKVIGVLSLVLCVQPKNSWD